jgi:hypothetical protein
MSETIEPQGQAGMAASEDPAEGVADVEDDGSAVASDEPVVEEFSSEDAAEG